MARVVVDVMPKPEILDPQGKAVLGALPRLGFDGVDPLQVGLGVPERDRIATRQPDRAGGVGIVERAGEGDDADPHSSGSCAVTV